VCNKCLDSIFSRAKFIFSLTQVILIFKSTQVYLKRNDLLIDSCARVFNARSLEVQLGLAFFPPPPFFCAGFGTRGHTHAKNSLSVAELSPSPVQLGFLLLALIARTLPM
jgi:hypothetical protein